MQSKKFYTNLGNSKISDKKEQLDPRDKFLVKTFNCSSKKILDLGCGKGYLTYEFAKLNNEVIGIDGSESMLNYAKIKNSHQNIKYILADLNNFEVNKKFDLVFAINTLVHLKNIDSSLKLILSSLKKQGKFILCFPHPLQDLSEIKDYSKEQIIKMETPYGVISQYYRPIEFYINKLIELDFKITKIIEYSNKVPYFFIIESQPA